ncbi:hypothetical protein B0O80DRAFT_465126 [Mortierella sp. GBAus27b]|nr:hypothetical protein B0O80DRAFT_465126 [Mortierella sp. GBAus27b]
MHMIKFGIITAGVVVPPLSTLKILDGLSDAQQYVKYLKGNIASLVDSAIKNIEGISGISEMGTELIAHHERINSLEAVEGPSLRQLQSYLRIEDQDQALGNLYRIVTAEGHVKWVCQDHFRSSYGESTIQLLRDFIESQNGYFIEKTGRIEIKIGSKHIARQFYDGIAKARGIQELEITLAWDATMSDLRALASAVSKANVIQLTVDGSHFKRPWDDVFNSRRRFDPIMQLARIERIRYLQLKCFDTFFPRVSQKSLMPSSKLRVFSMESGDQLSHKVIKFFHQLIKNHRQTTLKLGLTRLPVAESNRGIISKVFGFQSLKINLELSLSTRDSHSAAQDVELTIERLLDFRTRDFKFIQGIHPTRLVITYTPQEADEGRLATILRHSPKLAHLKVGCKGHRVPAIFDLVIETREGILKEDRSSGLRTFELLEEGLIPFDSCIACDDSTYIQTHVLFTDNSTKFDMETRIRLQGSIRDESNTLDEFVRRYKWSIVDR